MKIFKKQNLLVRLLNRSSISFLFFFFALGCVWSPAVWANATDLQLQVLFDNAMVNIDNPQNKYLELLVTAPEKGKWPVNRRPPLNICLVVDNSGSMNGTKIAHVKEAALRVLDILHFDDTFSLVTYNNRAQVLIPAQSKENMDLYLVRQRITSIASGGGTNIGAGLMAGYQELRQYYSSRHTNRILLLSDGHANQGMVSSVELGNLVQSYADGNLSLSTFGVGIHFNENLMAALSENGRGMYYFIDNAEQIGRIIEQEFNLCEAVAATGIELVVDFENGVTINKVMANKYELRNQKVIIPVGDISIGERRRYQIRIQPPFLHPGQHTVGSVKLTYTVAAQEKMHKENVPFFLHYEHNPSNSKAYTNSSVKERSAIFEAHFARGEAAKAVDRGELQLAQNILNNVSQRIQKQAAASSRVREEAQLTKEYADSLRNNPDSKVLQRVQKKVKYDTHALEGC